MDYDGQLFAMDAGFNAIEIALFIICGLKIALCLIDAVIALKFVCCGRGRSQETPERWMDRLHQVTLGLINAILAVGLLFYLQSDSDDLPQLSRRILFGCGLLYLALVTIVPMVLVVLSVRPPIRASTTEPVVIGSPSV